MTATRREYEEHVTEQDFAANANPREARALPAQAYFDKMDIEHDHIPEDGKWYNDEPCPKCHKETASIIKNKNGSGYIHCHDCGWAPGPGVICTFARYEKETGRPYAINCKTWPLAMIRRSEKANLACAQPAQCVQFGHGKVGLGGRRNARNNDWVSQTPAVTGGALGGLIGAIVICLALIAAVWLLVQLQGEGQVEPAPTVDYTDELAEAREQASYDVWAPAPRPLGWRATSADFETAGPVQSWHLGFLTPAEEYVGLEQSNGSTSDVVQQSTPADQPGEAVTIGGQEWQTLTSGDGETALVLVDSRGHDGCHRDSAAGHSSRLPGSPPRVTICPVPAARMQRCIGFGRPRTGSNPPEPVRRSLHVAGGPAHAQQPCGCTFWRVNRNLWTGQREPWSDDSTCAGAAPQRVARWFAGDECQRRDQRGRLRPPRAGPGRAGRLGSAVR